MNRSDQINELVAALAKAQTQFTPAVKETINPAFRGGYRYADLATIIKATQPALNANGLVMIQSVRCVCDIAITEVETLLAHTSGQFISDVLQLPATMRSQFDAQSAGSSQTYARRYAWQAILGLAAEDDDGNAAADQGSQEAADKVAADKIAAHQERQKKQAAGKVVEMYKSKVGELPVWCFVKSEALAILLDNGAGPITAFGGQSRYVLDEHVADVHEIAAKLNMTMREVPAPSNGSKPTEAVKSAPVAQHLPNEREIGSVTEKMTAKGQPYAVIAYAGQNYSCFHSSVYALLERGSWAELKLEKSGKYQNVVDIISLDGKTFTTNQDGVPTADIQRGMEYQAKDSDLPEGLR